MTKSSSLTRLFWLLIPVTIVIATVLWFLSANPVVTLFDRPTAESLIIEQIMLEPGRIDLVVRNDGDEALTIAQVTINDTAWISLILPKPIIERFGRATIQLDDYEWIEGQAYRLVIYTSKANQFVVDIPHATATPKPTQANVLTLLLNGLLIGLLPIYAGLFWWPIIRQASIESRAFWLALIIAILLWRGVALVTTSPRFVADVSTAFQGWSLVAIGGGITILWLAGWRAQQQRDDQVNPLLSLYRLALVVGLISLGEGIVVGYTISGKLFDSPLWLSSPLWLVGVVILNLSKGVALALSVRQEQPIVTVWVLAGFLAGFPALLGVLISGFTAVGILLTLLLGAAFGAVIWLVFELSSMVMVKSEYSLRWRYIAVGATIGFALAWLVNLLT